MSFDAVKKKYSTYDLPDFNGVNKEFEISAIEVDEWDFLNSVCRAVTNKFNKFLSYVSPFFIPGGYYSNVIMSQVKDKATIERAQKAYKDVMGWYHKSLLAEMQSDEEQVAFFNAMWKEYFSLKKEVVALLEICDDVFSQEVKKKPTSSGGYLG